MAGLVENFIRRIEKLIIGRASVPLPGTNHIDDNWSNTDIYPGELSIELTSGSLYTTDGEAIIDLNRENLLLSGLVLGRDTSGVLKLTVSSGYARIEGKTYYHTSSGTDILLPANTGSDPILYFVYGVASTTTYGSGASGNYQLNLSYEGVTGSVTEPGIFSAVGSTADLPPGPTGSLLLGAVLLNVGSTGYDLWPLSVASIGDYYPKFSTSPSELLRTSTQKVSSYESNSLYFPGAFVIDDSSNTIYLSKRIFVSDSASISNDISSANIVPLGGSGGGGTASYTATSLGSGANVYKTTVGTQFQFRSLTASGLITLTEGANEITIGLTTSGLLTGATSIGSGSNPLAGVSGSVARFRSLTAGSSNITIGVSGDDIIIDVPAIGGTSEGLNLGATANADVYAGMSGPDLTFRRLAFGTGMSGSQSSDSITIFTTAKNNQGTNVGSGPGQVYAGMSGSNLENLMFRSITGGGIISVSTSGNVITISATGGSGSSSAINVGTGATLFGGLSGSDIKIKTLVEGNNIIITDLGDEISIDSTIADGVQGPSGTQGFQGFDGFQGSQGWQGSTGASGQDGTDGVQGFQGSAGTQGFRGFQGAEGFQGPAALVVDMRFVEVYDNTGGYQVNVGGNKLLSFTQTRLNNDASLYTVGSTVQATSPNGTYVEISESGNYIFMFTTTAVLTANVTMSCSLFNLTTSTQVPGSIVRAWEGGISGKHSVTGKASVAVTPGQKFCVRVDVTGTSGNITLDPNASSFSVHKLEVGIGSQGVEGTGAQGYQGYEGPQGFQGWQGFQGGTGAGFQGYQGLQGYMGWQGFQGAQGIQGAQGFYGPQGFQGWQGDIGPTGVGAQGFQGSQGAQGAQGAQGRQGVQGPQGAQGAQGAQGVQGFDGPQGVQGFQGPTGGGSQGFQGFQGWQGRQGVQGSQGTQGVQGVQGNQGSQGWQGSGAQGSQGAQGVQGVQGIQGRQGFQGPSMEGVQGFQGWQGAQGSQGTQGRQGAQGPQGIQGAQGLQGPQGVQGAQGRQGFLGFQGAQGSQGVQGSQGSQGSQGRQGPLGFQGFQGRQGIQGAIGFQGWQGSTGSASNDGGVSGRFVRQASAGGAGTFTTTGTTSAGTIRINQFDSNNNDLSGVHDEAILWYSLGNALYIQITEVESTPVRITEIRKVTGTPSYLGSGIWEYPTTNIVTAFSPYGNGNTYTLVWSFTGAIGFQGYQGPLGFQGPANGAQGFQGWQGFQGSQGIQGSQGFYGSQGFQGWQGPGGGAQGFQGFQGPAGAGGATISQISYSYLLSNVGSTGLTGGFYVLSDFATTGWVLGSSGFNGATYSSAVGATSFIGPTEPLLIQVHNDGSTSWVDREAKSLGGLDGRNDIIYYSLGYESDYPGSPDPLDRFITDRAYNIGDDVTPIFPPDFKGVIYYRENPIVGIKGAYDWREFKFLRWTMSAYPAYATGSSYSFGAQVSHAGFNYVCIQNSPSDQLLGKYDHITNRTIGSPTDSTFAKEKWLRLGPHSVPYISPLVALYGNDSTNAWNKPYLQSGNTWRLTIGQGATDGTASPMGATVTLGTGWLCYTFSQYDQVTDTLYNGANSVLGLLRNIDLGNRGIGDYSIYYSNFAESYFFSESGDNVIFLNSNGGDSFVPALSNIKFEGLSTSNTIYTNPPILGGDEFTSLWNSLDISGNTLKNFGGNTVWVNYTNVIGVGATYTGDPQVERLLNIFHNNTLEDVTASFLLDGLSNSKISGVRSSVIETCSNLEIDGEINLVLGVGATGATVGFFPYGASAPDPQTGNSPTSIYSLAVWRNPFNYVSNNLLRTSSYIKLRSPEKLYLADSLKVSGTMKYSYFSSLQDAEIASSTLSVIPTNNNTYPSYGLRVTQQMVSSYLGSVVDVNIKSISSCYIQDMSYTHVMGNLTGLTFTTWNNNRVNGNMVNCIGTNFNNNVIDIPTINSLDFTPSILQATDVTKYHFWDLSASLPKLYYFNYGTMNITDSDY